MLSDEQFQKLLENISMNEEDRKCLVRIETIVSMNRESSDKCKLDVAEKIATVKAAATKAHERIDEEQRARFIFTGILCSIAGIATITGIVLKLTGKI
jgi:hypothetical protein